MSEDKNKVITQGKPWTTVGTFDSYENASNQVMHLIAVAPTYDYKIKRCGPLGTQFVIKSRLNPKLDEAEKKLNEKSLAISEARDKKKTNKKSKK